MMKARGLTRPELLVVSITGRLVACAGSRHVFRLASQIGKSETAAIVC